MVTCSGFCLIWRDIFSTRTLPPEVLVIGIRRLHSYDCCLPRVSVNLSVRSSRTVELGEWLGLLHLASPGNETQDGLAKTSCWNPDLDLSTGRLTKRVLEFTVMSRYSI